MMLQQSTEPLTTTVCQNYSLTVILTVPKGWLVKVTVTDDTELEGLMDEETYAEFCAEEDN